MMVRIRLFAITGELAGRGTVELELPADCTVADLRRGLRAAIPELDPVIRQVRFAVNREFVPDAAPIPPAAEVACIPPVSGG